MAGLAAGGVFVIAHGLLTEEEGKHGADLGHLEWEAFRLRCVEEGVAHLRAHGLEEWVGVGVFELFQRGDASGHGERVAAESAGLIDGAEGRELIHDLGLAAEGTDGEAAADDFTQRGEVGRDADAFLHATGGDAKAGHDLVENEYAAVGGAELAHQFEVAGVGENESAVGGVGLDDDRGDGLALLGEGSAEGIGVVIIEDDRLGGEAGGDACAIGVAEGECAGAGFDEERVDVAVVAAGEFNDLVAPRVAARETDGRHGGLGAGVAHADFFDRGHELDDEFGHGDFVRIGRAKAGAVFECFGDGSADVGIVVPVDGRPPSADEVDEVDTVGGGQVGALGTLSKEGCAADGAESTHGRVDPAGDELLGAGEKLFGSVHVVGYVLMKRSTFNGKRSTHKDEMLMNGRGCLVTRYTNPARVFGDILTHNKPSPPSPAKE